MSQNNKTPLKVGAIYRIRPGMEGYRSIQRFKLLDANYSCEVLTTLDNGRTLFKVGRTYSLMALGMDLNWAYMLEAEYEAGKCFDSELQSLLEDKE